MDWRPHRRPGSTRPALRARPAPPALALIAAAVLPVCSTAHAGVITDKSFFSGLPTTTINFETDGAGAAVSLIDGQALTMPTSAYAAQGVMFQNQISWVNDGGIDFDVAQFLGGSPDIGIPSSGVSSFTINFTVPVRSVGMFVVNTFISDAVGPTFVARDEQGAIIETVSFGTQTGGSQFVDARFNTADYGFMGVFSSTPIASITVSKLAAMFDDLTFSAQVPAPAGALLLTLAGARAARRRRS